MPGRLRSSVYLPAPVVLPAASIIAVGLPMMEKSLILYVSFRAKRGICFLPVAQHYFAAAIPCFSAAIAARIASYIWLYPVQRHRLLLSAARKSPSDGSGFSASSDFTVITKPGV